MADNGHGGKRLRAGRKSKAEELKIAEKITEIVGDEGKEAVIKKLYEQAKSGSFHHMQLFLAYAFGKPTERIDMTSKGERLQITGMVVK